MKSLDGLNVLVTGANRGLGHAFVNTAIAMGAAKVYAASRGAKVDDEFTSEHVVTMALDVTDLSSIRDAAAFACDVDLLISNAGKTASDGHFAISDEEVAEIIAVNLTGPAHLMRVFAPVLASRGRGGILLVSSIGGLYPGARSPVYHGSKAGIAMLAISVQAELAENNISLSVAYPGPVATRMTERHPNMEKAAPETVAQCALEGWLAGELAIFPDPFSQAIAKQLALGYKPGLPPSQP